MPIPLLFGEARRCLRVDVKTTGRKIKFRNHCRWSADNRSCHLERSYYKRKKYFHLDFSCRLGNFYVCIHIELPFTAGEHPSVQEGTTPPDNNSAINRTSKFADRFNTTDRTMAANDDNRLCTVCNTWTQWLLFVKCTNWEIVLGERLSIKFSHLSPYST